MAPMALPIMKFTASLAALACSGRSPKYQVLRPIASNSGCTASSARASPAARILSWPASATLTRPSTGAATGHAALAMQPRQLGRQRHRHGGHVDVHRAGSQRGQRAGLQHRITRGRVVGQHGHQRIGARGASAGLAAACAPSVSRAAGERFQARTT